VARFRLWLCPVSGSVMELTCERHAVWPRNRRPTAVDRTVVSPVARHGGYCDQPGGGPILIAARIIIKATREIYAGIASQNGQSNHHHEICASPPILRAAATTVRNILARKAVCAVMWPFQWPLNCPILLRSPRISADLLAPLRNCHREDAADDHCDTDEPEQRDRFSQDKTTC
jgi:hypothetical protein